MKIIQVLLEFWYLIPLLITSSIMRSSWFKGIFGEFIVNVSASHFLNKKKYYLFKNITLPAGIGTTQIDHVIVSEYGVFVIETKNMKGWIFGRENQKMWTQKIFKKSFKFQNPLLQNYKHKKTLESLLGLNDNEVISVIVFVGGSTFKQKMPENVTYGLGFLGFIKSKQNIIIKKDKINKIKKDIESDRLKRSFKTNREHVKHVKEIIDEKSIAKICPKCSSDMIMRSAKRGVNAGNKFWGCIQYPICRKIVKIK